MYLYSFTQWTSLGSKDEWSSVQGAVLHRKPLPPRNSVCLGTRYQHKNPQPAVKMPRQKLHHMPWEQRGDSRTLLLDEFLHVQTYLYITYSLYLWQGWMALFYPTPGIFQELQTDSGRWGQAGMCSWKEVGKQLRGQTGLPIASHSGRTLPATHPGAGE